MALNERLMARLPWKRLRMLLEEGEQAVALQVPTCEALQHAAGFTTVAAGLRAQCP